MAKKILGIDLGVSSIGWALIEEAENENKIISMGVRIIPLSTDETDEFSKGNAITKNQDRTTKRTQRRGYDRYQMRRKALTKVLIENDMFDPELFKLKALELWGLRSKAVNEQISLKELGRVLYHLNQKRGYKSARKVENEEKKDTKYVEEVKNRYDELKNQGITIGHKFYNELLRDPYYRIKEQVYPREAYIEEFDKIMSCQQKFYPQILTNEIIDKIRNDIIYYQRPLKSQKSLVSVCEFEGKWIKITESKEIFIGPKVAPRTSPLFQVCKIWETINNIEIKNKNGEKYKITIEKKNEIFQFLDHNEKITQKELFKILDLNSSDGWYGNKQIQSGLQGNITKSKILKELKNYSYDNSITDFNIEIEDTGSETYLLDRKTGEIFDFQPRLRVSPNIEKQPLYQLWHVIYSVDDEEECKNVLIKKFGLIEEAAERLARIDFKTPGFGNKSVRAMRNILPYLMKGYHYSDACSLAGYNHSNSLTKDENLQKKLKDKIELLQKNSLRQPVVEKILNQLINLVNAIIDEKRGWVTREERLNNQFEIRIELARELKQTKEERNKTLKNQNDREKQNKIAAERLAEYRLKATRNNIIKWRLFHEMTRDESKINAQCIYCGKMIGIADALTGNGVDVEHIIPKSLLFDDSQDNKTLSHRACNAEKGNRTAYDYMKAKGEETFNTYVERVKNLYENKLISKSKRDKLLMSEDKIPDDFINRQLRESAYISRKAREILSTVCYNVWSTSGNVTAYLRSIWGWEDALMELEFPKYKEKGLTENVEWDSNGNTHKKEIIKDWAKRDDHRHHAMDALTIACTKQGFIQRINTLSSKKNREEMMAELQQHKIQIHDRLSLLDKYFIAKRPFTTEEVKKKLSQIFVSFKPGKKVATKSVRKVKIHGKKIVVQRNILTPRGPLSEESVYGKIKVVEKDKPLRYLFENPDLIINNVIREKVNERLAQYNNDSKSALKSLKKDPIYLDKDKTLILEKAHCYKEEYVIKYPISSINEKDVDSIIDKKVRELVRQRLNQFYNKPKEAFKEPLYFDDEKRIPIRTVRMFTGLSAVEPIRTDAEGNPIAFVKPGNNHHVGIYIDIEGNYIEHVCTFWHAVERKKYGLPVIIDDTSEIWEKILNSDVKFPQSFLDKLPPDGLKLVISMQQNEMFLFGFSEDEIIKYLEDKEYSILSNNLYRVQKISTRNYVFRHHIETSLKDDNISKEMRKFYLFQSLKAFLSAKPLKVYVDALGNMSLSLQHN
ncbi:MAG TPA: type II CRISPR RNA-guided endonuclease Cas9 [Bacteroidales bacterium]|nr:type II CRISPR RNA-guided endonuclease Cas9 [Bacteroidales bacterium]